MDNIIKINFVYIPKNRQNPRSWSSLFIYI